ncbi:hypothetical protein PN497_16155 [Sphaerospermopsis kisseleviana CS-549]|uniref:Transposase n=1 Tax=Sphaerospermopsis kisseleviana CS-549 TaxID=3021783 RepID=A0ABT4ZTX9_9CYAN|nr:MULTISPECIES: hypothetical protein [Sphaerospermopsis]MBD2133240.1 hypothetical protein [Sphaerospermopsis sp. FACHB-1094]MDB9442881.1 hypothetical protein [Sphaerospermopsis kisseleviana CS-549]
MRSLFNLLSEMRSHSLLYIQKMRSLSKQQKVLNSVLFYFKPIITL